MGYLFLFQIMFFVFTRTCSSTPTYGPFQVKILGIDVCAGPRQKNCTTMDPSATVLNGGILNLSFKVLYNVSPTKAKIVAHTNGKELVRFRMDKPCDHLFIRPLLESMFTMSKNCVVLKGDYKLKLDMDDMLRTYFGGKFFYGNVTFRSVAYGRDCNFSCTNTLMAIIPKK